MDLLTGIFTAFGLSASAGLNAYIPLLVVAVVARFTNLITLTSPYNTLENLWVIGFLLVLSLIEFFADKIPAVNHFNDAIQTFVRPAAGAIAFAASAQVITDINPIISLVAGLLVAGGVHVVKSSAVRPAVTASTGGVGNTAVSVVEDVLSALISVLAIIIPIIVGTLLIVVTSWIVWWMWRRANREQMSSKGA